MLVIVILWIIASIASIASWSTGYAYASTRHWPPATATAAATRVADKVAFADRPGIGIGKGIQVGGGAGVRLLSLLSSLVSMVSIAVDSCGWLCVIRCWRNVAFIVKAIAIKKFLPNSNCELACAATCGTRDARPDTVSLDAPTRALAAT